jgi:uncharacterized protein YwqG
MKQEKLVRQADLAQFEKTRKEFVQLELVKPEGELKLWDSKAGGHPYLPKISDYPLNQAGRPLHFLAQLNLRELPKVPDFPERGILSFFIDLNDDVFGMNFDQKDDQAGFRVLFFEDVEENEELLTTDFSSIDEDRSNCEYDVLEGGEYRIQGRASSMFNSTGDHRFDELIGESSLDYFEGLAEQEMPEGYEEVDDLYNDYSNPEGGVHHQMGGYPYFTQMDPREDGSEYDTLLFQLDSDYDKSNGKYAVIWGDVGICNFFINESDLKALRFDRILFNWDCC